MDKQSRILLLEDEPPLREGLTLFLAAQGYSLIAAASPEQCESLLRTLGWDWPDLVICDVNLCREPEVTLGYAFYAWWRARFPMPPFVFMHEGEPLPRFPDPGNSWIGHIRKPLTASELLPLVRAILAR